MAMASDALSPAAVHNLPQFLEAVTGNVQMDSAGDPAEHGARRYPHHRPVGVVGWEPVGDVAGTLPTGALAAPMSRLVNQPAARMCQSNAGRRSPAASSCPAIMAAFASTDSGSSASIVGGHPPVQCCAIRLELRLVGHCANQRMVKHILGLSVESDLLDELAAKQVLQGQDQCLAFRAGPG